MERAVSVVLSGVFRLRSSLAHGGFRARYIHYYAARSTLLYMSDVISVSQASEILGVGASRVRALLREGRIDGQRLGRDWVVDPCSLPRYGRRVRPMSQRMAWALLDSELFGELSSAERLRIRKKRQLLAEVEAPELLLRDWVCERAKRRVLHSRSLEALADDERMVLSGASDARSGMLGAGLVEAYVRAKDLSSLVVEHLLVEPESRQFRNVYLHVVDHMPEQLSTLVIAADLADHDSAREMNEARRLIAEEGAI